VINSLQHSNSSLRLEYCQALALESDELNQIFCFMKKYIGFDSLHHDSLTSNGLEPKCARPSIDRALLSHIFRVSVF
jgi:hypothetical protein